MDAQQLDQLLKKKASRARVGRIALYSVVAVLCVALLGGLVAGAYYAGSWIADRTGEKPVETPTAPPVQADVPGTEPPQTAPSETSPVATEPSETNPPETEPPETKPTQPGEITHTLQLVWFEDGVERPWKVGITVLHNRKQIKTFNLLQDNGWRYEWTDTYHASELTLCGEFLEGMSGVVSVNGENFILSVILADPPETQPAETSPTTPLDPTLPPAGLDMWPAAVLLAAGVALFALGLGKRRWKKR